GHHAGGGAVVTVAAAVARTTGFAVITGLTGPIRFRWIRVGRAVVALTVGHRQGDARLLLDPARDCIGARVDAAAAARRSRVVETPRGPADQVVGVESAQIHRPARVAKAGVDAAATGDELA